MWNYFSNKCSLLLASYLYGDCVYYDLYDFKALSDAKREIARNKTKATKIGKCNHHHLHASSSNIFALQSSCEQVTKLTCHLQD